MNKMWVALVAMLVLLGGWPGAFAEEWNLLKNADGSVPKKGRSCPESWWMEGDYVLAVSKEEGIQIKVNGPWKPRATARLTQAVSVEPQSDYILTAQIRGTIDKIGFAYIEFLEPNGDKPGYREFKKQPRINSGAAAPTGRT